MNTEQQLREALDHQPVDVERAWEEQLWRIGAAAEAPRPRTPWFVPLVAAACIASFGGAVVVSFQPSSTTTTPAAQTVPITPLDPAVVGDQALPFSHAFDYHGVSCENQTPTFSADQLYLGDQGGQDLVPMRSALGAADQGRDGPTRGVPAAEVRFFFLASESSIGLEVAPGQEPAAGINDRRVLLAVGDWGPSGPIGDAAGYAVLAETDGEYTVQSWGDCTLTRSLKPGLNWTELSNPSADPSSSALTVEVAETACTGGRDPSAYLQQPVVVETDTSVTVFWATTESPGGDCVGNPTVTRQLQLDNALGNRAVLNGATWPATPIS